MHNDKSNVNEDTDVPSVVRVPHTTRVWIYVTLIVAIAFIAYLTATEYKLLYAFNMLCAGFAFALISDTPGIWPFSNRLTVIVLLTLMICNLIINRILIT